MKTYELVKDVEESVESPEHALIHEPCAQYKLRSFAKPVRLARLQQLLPPQLQKLATCPHQPGD